MRIPSARTSDEEGDDPAPGAEPRRAVDPQDPHGIVAGRDAGSGGRAGHHAHGVGAGEIRAPVRFRGGFLFHEGVQL